MKKIIAIISIVCTVSLLLISCTVDTATESNMVSVPVADVSEGSLPDDLSFADTTSFDLEFTDRDKEGNYDKDEVIKGEDNGTTYDITKEGTYIFSGDITDKMITVNVGDEDKVQIVLDNAHITSSNGPCIYIGSGDKVFITAKDGTENSISDGSGYTLTDDNGEIDGAIFSRADLTINGGGKLTVNGNTKHGIVSKDDLVIVSTALNVTAKNVALNGKDCVKITDATLTLNAGSDGIRSDNAEDADRGFVYIQSGTLDITAANDGIQAETVVMIDTADINIKSGGGSTSNNYYSDESYKGIKGVSDVIIANGNFVIDSLDDAIHSNNTVCITGGNYTLSTGDDGIHADTDLAISAGEFSITKSYEGLEASRIFISGGEIDITASDDGLNAAGGNDSSSEQNPAMNGGMAPPNGGATPPGGFGGGMGGPGMDAFSNGVGEISISGGYIHVNASGDGLDSNGTFAISGGVVLVSGPQNGGNGGFDYGSSANVTGGVLIITSSRDMAMGFTNAENQGTIFTTFNNIAGGTNIAVCDTEGKVIACFTPEKAYASVVVTAPEIQQGGTYKIVSGITVDGADEKGYARNVGYSGGTEITEITMSSLINNASGGMGGPGMGGPGMGGGPGGTRPGRP